MRSIWVIFKREFTQYFVSPIAYLVAFAILVLIALNFNGDLEQRILNRETPDGGLVVNSFAFVCIWKDRAHNKCPKCWRESNIGGEHDHAKT